MSASITAPSSHGFAAGALRLVEVPERHVGIVADPHAASQRDKPAAQLAAVPAARAHPRRPIRGGAVAVVLPVFLGERAEVERAAAEPREVLDSAPRPGVVHVLEDVVADDQIEAPPRPELLDGAAPPAVSRAEVIAGVEPDVLSAPERAQQRAAQGARAAACVSARVVTAVLGSR